ncbi:MAG TPA: 30S ribosomal protein S12 methylthiotransferase RimO [Firmicutes bacterium]|nr:30S ribosomal protein S12 methylthiotransferase RimO [Candidatus Fermentithermobacillaceae bacterium]
MSAKSCCILVYGCAKNQVDAEEMASRLRAEGFAITGDPRQADVIIVHTCGFIEPAKKESIRGIFEACQAAKEQKEVSGKEPRVIVTGCLSQRYPDELLAEIPEIAGVAGTSSPRDIVEIVGEVLSGEQKVKRVGPPGRGVPGDSRHRLKEISTPWAYLRVSEGCRHRCTYCAIPSIRGSLVSRPEEDILEEARVLASRGAREINLIAQDLSDYGLDLYGERRLPQLIERLGEIPGVLWIRLLYVRPDGVTGKLAQAMTGPKVVPYVDLPIEHGSRRVLKMMGRPGPQTILEAVRTLREKLPGISIRTTIIAGFPGETEEDVEKTREFLSAIRPHRVGVFPYSPEENTPASRFPGLLPERIREERAEAIRRLGLELSREHSESLIGKEIPVLLLRPSSRNGYWIGRGPHQAPEVDGKIYVRAEGTAGDIVTAKVTRAGYLDLWARAITTP